MLFRYFYLDLEINLNSAARPELVAQQILTKAIQELFGECSGVQVDILSVNSQQEPSRVLVRVNDTQLRKLRAAITLSPRNIRVLAEAPTFTTSITEGMSSRRVWETGEGGRHMVVVAPREELAAPSSVALPPPEPAPGLIKPDGSINWGCPCLGGMATGPCGQQFRDAFSCFHYSEAEPKGSDCYEKFSVMQECMSQYPELYAKEDDDDELAAALEEAAESKGDKGDAVTAEHGVGDKATEDRTAASADK